MKPDCVDCPHKVEDGPAYCRLTKKALDKIAEVPKWCRIRDAERIADGKQ